MRNDAIGGEREQYVFTAEARLTRLFTGDDQLESWLRAGLAFGLPDANAEGRVQLLQKAQLISAATFEALMGAGDSYKPMFVHEIWDALVRARIFIRQFREGRGDAMLADHLIDVHRLLEHLQDGTFANLFYSPHKLHERYSPAVVAIDVKTAQGDLKRGSGFIVKVDDTSSRWIVTCLHNVEPGAVKVEAFTSGTGRAIEVGEPLLSEGYDVAFFPTRTDIQSTPLVLRDTGTIFDEVFSLGYPAVPRSESVLLGHRGEINARLNVIVDRHPAIIISNLVSPGSSGGPVLDREGRCVGMSIRWLEGEWDGERARFSAALPATIIRDELSRLRGDARA